MNDSAQERMRRLRHWRAYVRIASVLPLLVVILLLLYVERCDTRYAAGFSWPSFWKTKEGESMALLQQRLGNPISIMGASRDIEEWKYGLFKLIVDSSWNGEVKGDVLAKVTEKEVQVLHEDLSTARSKYGSPNEISAGTGYEYWKYSESPGSTNYWIASFLVDTGTGTILRKYSYFYYD